MDYNLICKLPFGTYVQVHDDLDVTNTIESRTTGAISLGPTGNLEGTHKFFSLKTGEIIVRRKWDELPIPTDVIERLKELTTDGAEYEDGPDKEQENEEEQQLVAPENDLN